MLDWTTCDAFFLFLFFTKESILHFSFCVLHKQPLNHYKSMGDLQNSCWMFGCYSQQEFLAWQLVYKWIARIFHLGERIPNINHVKFFFWQWIDLIVIRHEPLLLRVSLLVVFFFQIWSTYGSTIRMAIESSLVPNKLNPNLHQLTPIPHHTQPNPWRVYDLKYQTYHMTSTSWVRFDTKINFYFTILL